MFRLFGERTAAVSVKELCREPGRLCRLLPRRCRSHRCRPWLKGFAVGLSHTLSRDFVRWFPPPPPVKVWKRYPKQRHCQQRGIPHPKPPHRVAAWPKVPEFRLPDAGRTTAPVVPVPAHPPTHCGFSQIAWHGAAARYRCVCIITSYYKTFSVSLDCFACYHFSHNALA